MHVIKHLYVKTEVVVEAESRQPNAWDDGEHPGLRLKACITVRNRDIIAKIEQQPKGQ